jgi:serpin B
MLTLALVAAGCSSGADPQPTPDPRTRLEAVDARVLSACTRMGLKLFGEVAKADTSKDLMLSPPSVLLALSMALNGADGETRSAMASALEMSGMTLEEINAANALLMAALPAADPKVTLTLANSLWARQGVPFEDGFVQRCRDTYQAEVSTLDFADPNAPTLINNWVKQETNGKIESIIDNIPSEMILYLINAIYFKGSWTTRFDPALTRDGTFNLTDGTQVQCPMMAQSREQLHLDGDGFRAVFLPYGEGKLGMYLFLPDEDAGLDGFLSTLNAANWDAWMGQFHRSDVDLTLPRFRFEYEVTLNDALAALGMAVAFDPDRADFSEMTPVDAFISEVKHKTFVDVNEEGTEAAAVTSVGVGTTSVPVRVTLSFTRPFFFAIRHNPTGTVLFMGAVRDPR